MQRIFLSDLHLDDPQAATFQRFAECLAREAERVDEIYVLGDLVEMWIGDDDDSPTATTLAEVFKRTTAMCPVFLMHGNRDFLFGEAFVRRTGVQLIDDPYLTADGLLLTHGDALCTDDLEYQNMRTLLRSAAWQADILSKSLQERQAFGQALREQSKSSNANKAANIMDVNAAATAALMDAQQPAQHVLVHGHTHRPGVHQAAHYTRIVTGAWERCGWLCRQRDQQLHLECFSLARHYGT
jgi:UDP-2,3-diacylglucosamine hydrolase